MLVASLATQTDWTMNELQETIKSICDEFADISAILTARSRELDRRELFDKEIETEIKNIKKE